MKKVLLAGFGIVAAASSAMGEQVTATKRSPIMTPIENVYGRVEVRQTSLSDRTADHSSRSNRVASYSLVPRLGTKAFNNRLNLYVESPLKSVIHTSTFAQTQPAYVGTFAALEAEHFSITPYVQGGLPHKEARLSSLLAVNFDASSSIETGMGALSFHGGIEPELSTGTKVTKVKANVMSNGALALAEDGSVQTKEVAPQEPTPIMEYSAGVSFTPSIAPKFSLGVNTYVDREFAPVYVVMEDEAGSRQEKTGYAITDASLSDIVLAYKADSLTTIQSLTRIRQNGVLASVPSIEQRLSLIVKLF